jgi:hypothetical protein
MTPGTPTSTIPTDLWQADASALPISGNYIYMKSEMGDLVPDFIGAGLIYLYTANQSEQVQVSVKDGHITFGIYDAKSNSLWHGDFEAVGKPNPISASYYPNAHRYPYQAATESGMSIVHDSFERACNQSNGWFTVDRIDYVGTQVAALDLRFEQHCEGNAPALHGKIHWTFDISPRPKPGPTAPPAGLWQASPALPSTMNYAYLESDLGDFPANFYGNPTANLFTAQNAVFQLDSSSDRLIFRIRGDWDWDAEMAPPPGQQRLQTGYYGDVGGLFGDTQGYLKWNGPGGAGGARQGGTYQSWLMVDSITYEGDAVVALDLRFEQHGGGMRPGLRGQVHWRRADTTVPPGPVNPPPGNLWRPPADINSTVGNYVYLQSDVDDFIGQGKTTLYTPDRTEFALMTRPGSIEIRVIDSDLWVGTFQGVIGVDQLQPGYYGDLQAITRANPAKGALYWIGHSRSCERLTGWYVVDHIAYANGAVSALDLRFEQHCEGATAALHGAIHWTR